MEQRQVDVAIIGTGTAGMVAYKAARKHTDSVLAIEGGEYGTTCARIGCMPSKLMIAAADAAHTARGAGLFGIRVNGMTIDRRAVMERVRVERDGFVGSVLDAIDRFPAEHRLHGMAKFVAPGRLVVDDRVQIDAKRIVIATGSSPRVPDLLQVAGDRLLTNDTVFELEQLPESVVVFGPGAIGLELGAALARLGVRIRLFGAGGGIGGIQDEQIRQCALETFREAFPLDPTADVKQVRRTDDGVSVTFIDPQRGEVTETFEYLLAATGRRPNLASLGLEKSGLALDDHGIPRFNRYTLQCGDQPVFMAGDVNADAPLLHEAADEGRIAGDNAGRWPDIRSGMRRTPLSIVFTDPQIIRVGVTGEALRRRYCDCHAVGQVSFEDQGRSRVIGRNRGLLKVYGEHGSGLFLGAEMLGPSAEHIGHLLAWAVQQRMTVSQMLGMPFYHPVIEEGVRTALGDLNHKLSIGPKMGERCLDCGPGA
ncbi:dihydrolipoyl dehydrogenase [Marinobacter halodurans]|uniref:Dihydrolipoyl dehydrogenase n=1 Tax=Marinobacter halodurans TaxID=2528979 RepID=A0ABY1ZPV0_9GAMM|nr:dihydrolipoyl dehydrogenase [Marinobacter halodurans]TBW58896.1 dihydrolipoyl dehydrogenase [Marinobacter halodurans]